MEPNLGAITYERKAVQTGWIRQDQRNPPASTAALALDDRGWLVCA